VTGLGTAPILTEARTGTIDASEGWELVLIIPVWQPDQALVELVKSLISGPFGRIVIVDDGSAPQATEHLGHLARPDQIVILHHQRNLGKGAALKTGLRWVSANLPGCAGVVTADADGQHRPEDILRVAEALTGTQRPVVGVRSLGPKAPWRSRAGNLAVRVLFWPIARRLLPDTQSGLRGFPARLIPVLGCVPGERYDYETAVLVELLRRKEPLLEMPIATVYTHGNSGSHFRPVLDSFRVCLLLLRLMLRPGKRS